MMPILDDPKIKSMFPDAMFEGDYHVLQVMSLASLVLLTRVYMEKGFLPTGGVFISPTGAYMQAVVASASYASTMASAMQFNREGMN